MTAVRLGDSRGGDMPAQAVIGAALSCIDAALAGWAAPEGDSRFETLPDLAFASVRALGRGVIGRPYAPVSRTT